MPNATPVRRLYSADFGWGYALTASFTGNSFTMTSSTAATSTASASAWLVWASETIYSTTSTDAAWTAWQPVEPLYVQPTALAVAAAENRAAALAASRRVAIIKADKLLESILNEVQRAHVQAHGYFVVRGKSGQLYRIRRGWAANVDAINARGEVTQRLCAHPLSYMPDGDLMAAQKLMLETADEELFLKTAIRHGGGGDRVPSEVMQAVMA